MSTPGFYQGRRRGGKNNHVRRGGSKHFLRKEAMAKGAFAANSAHAAAFAAWDAYASCNISHASVTEAIENVSVALRFFGAFGADANYNNNVQQQHQIALATARQVADDSGRVHLEVIDAYNDARTAATTASEFASLADIAAGNAALCDNEAELLQFVENARRLAQYTKDATDVAVAAAESATKGMRRTLQVVNAGGVIMAPMLNFSTGNEKDTYDPQHPHYYHRDSAFYHHF